jgi:hypothetical protein
MTPSEEICAAKKFFQTRREARKSARIIKRKYGQTMRVYPCKKCIGYHLTRLSKTELMTARNKRYGATSDQHTDLVGTV